MDGKKYRLGKGILGVVSGIGYEIEFFSTERYVGDSPREALIGVDGAGLPTWEIRTPPFFGSTLEESFLKSGKFLISVVDIVRKDFSDYVFAPFHEGVHLGFHFSLSGEWESKEVFDRIKKAALIIPQFCDSELWVKRAQKICPYPAAWNRDFYIEHSERTEFKFFPSGKVEDLLKWVGYILLGGEIPGKVLNEKSPTN